MERRAGVIGLSSTTRAERWHPDPAANWVTCEAEIRRGCGLQRKARGPAHLSRSSSIRERDLRGRRSAHQHVELPGEQDHTTDFSG